MRFVIEFLFPKYLGRLSYFIRMLLCNGVLLGVYQDQWGETAPGIATSIVALLYMSVFVLLPRIRDIGLSAGWLVLAFIPFVSSALGVVLLFRRSDPRNNPLFQRSPHVRVTPRPDAPAGPQ